MNREELIAKGMELGSVMDLTELRVRYEEWRESVLHYAEDDDSGERLRVLLHVMDTPYGTEEEKLDQYRTCIQSVVNYLRERAEEFDGQDALKNVIKNFGLYLKYMFRTAPVKQSTLKKEILGQIEINNEYDVQHMMYAVIKALYPSARREVNQDTGYGTVRYDIVIREIDTVIEIKCTRKDLSDSKLLRELGEDGYFYSCSKLLIYVYDKQQKIRDVENFVRSLERTKKTGGKDVKVYVEQANCLI